MRINPVILFFLLVGPFGLSAQNKEITISGAIADSVSSDPVPFANVVLMTAGGSSFVAGTISDEDGLFILESIAPSDYILQIRNINHFTYTQSLFVGSASDFIDIGRIFIQSKVQDLEGAVVTGKQDDVSGKLDKKTYEIDDNISQQGGSILQAMQNLPSVTIQDGKVQLRGNPNVIILIDGKQSALTGFGNQSGLENIPASAIERIEIINNPSAKYEANGSAGIINIILKKQDQNGFNGKVGLSGGLGALWIKKENLPMIRDQYQFTPKINPSLSLNYRKENVNVFLQADYLYTETLNKNEFVTRTYDDGTVINQQSMRNRNTGFLTTKLGMDWNLNDRNTLTVFGLYGSEDIIDHGDQPFYNEDFSDQTRVWRFLEDEFKTTIVGSATYLHKFKQAGRQISFGANYTFHREDEQYYFKNINPTFTGLDTFKLISDEQVFDFSIDYTRPLKYGKFETGVKLRDRIIPTNMLFIPGLNSQIDSAAGGWADYNEIIPALYGNYSFQNKKFDAEVGLRVEYVKVDYLVNPTHPTYSSDGYDYIQPFPNVRFGYRLNDKNKLTAAFNRRVNRPNEVDIRIFPKYDDAEIIKVGNPELQPQFTNKAELGYKLNLKNGYFYSALYGQMTDATITRIGATVPGSTLIYNVFQNAGRSYNAGIELIYSTEIGKWLSLNANANAYYNQIDSFSVINKYPITDTLNIGEQSIYSGNAKMTAVFHLKNNFEVQLTGIYLAPDIIPQGKIDARFSLDLGIQKTIQKGKGLIFLNATDLLNTMVIRREIVGEGFTYSSDNFSRNASRSIGVHVSFLVAFNCSGYISKLSSIS